MNWYKTAQQIGTDIRSQYAQLMQQAKGIQITGSGQNETVNIPGGQSIVARNILEKVKMRLAPILIQNHVHTIDTSPISNPQAQGLAISHEPGIIHVDVRKIFQNAKSALPPTSQFDGTQVDPDIVQSLVNQVSNWLEGELFETTSHESQHVLDFSGAAQSGQPFTSVQEAPAEQYGRQMRERFVQPFKRNLPY